MSVPNCKLANCYITLFGPIATRYIWSSYFFSLYSHEHKPSNFKVFKPVKLWLAPKIYVYNRHYKPTFSSSILSPSRFSDLSTWPFRFVFYIITHTDTNTFVKSYTDTYSYIIIIILSCHQHGYPWPSLATPTYRSSLWQVLRATPCILTELLYVGASWLPWLCSALWRGP